MPAHSVPDSGEALLYDREASAGGSFLGAFRHRGAKSRSDTRRLPVPYQLPGRSQVGENLGANGSDEGGTASGFFAMTGERDGQAELVTHDPR